MHGGYVLVSIQQIRVKGCVDNVFIVRRYYYWC